MRSITLGAYVAIWVTQKGGMFNVGALDPVPGYLVTIAIMFVVGMVLERLAYAPLRGRSVHVVVIATLGAAIVVHRAHQALAGDHTEVPRHPGGR